MELIPGEAVAALPWWLAPPRTAPVCALNPLTKLRKEKYPINGYFSFGADTGIRTRDLVLTKDVLYLLSHISKDMLSILSVTGPGGASSDLPRLQIASALATNSPPDCLLNASRQGRACTFEPYQQRYVIDIKRHRSRRDLVRPAAITNRVRFGYKQSTGLFA